MMTLWLPNTAVYRVSTQSNRLSRRAVLGALGGGAILPFMPRVLSAELLDSLAFFGPPAGPSITLAHAVAHNMFADITRAATFTAWRSPDELRAGLTSGQIELSVVPVQAAANLYNRGFPIRLVNVMTEGLLYVVTADPAIDSITALKERRIAVAFAGDTPDILLDRLLAHNGLDPSKNLTKLPTATPIEAMQMLLAGRADAALVGEPAASAAVVMGRAMGQKILRGIDLQAAWGEMTGKMPVLPQAGLAVTQSFLDAHGDAMTPVQDVLEAAVAEVRADPPAAAEEAAQSLGLPAPVIAESVAPSNLIATPAAQMRPQIDAMLSAMTSDAMELIGGKLPDDGFYL